MVRFLIILLLFLTSKSTFAFCQEESSSDVDFFQEKFPQTDTYDYQITSNDLVGWYFPIQAGETSFQGLGVTVEFSTGDQALNKSIVVIGTEYNAAIDYGLNFKENNNSIRVSRHVRLGDHIGFFDTDAWDNNLLKRNTNYILNIEIDETRFRYSICEKGFEQDKKYEYEFSGLANSYFREQLQQFRLAVAVSLKGYATQNLKVYDLGYGVGVEPILPQTAIRYAHIKNKNSSLYMRRFGTTGTSDHMTQAALSNSANDIFKVEPNREINRLPNQYPVTIKALYKNTFVAPEGCSTLNNAYIRETESTDCNVWTMSRESGKDWQIKNNHSNGLLYVLQNSTAANANLLQATEGVPVSSEWILEDVYIASPLPDGYYKLKVYASGKYMRAYLKDNRPDVYIVQHSEDGSDADVWYLEKQPEGTYSIRNIDSEKYLCVLGGSFAPDAYLSQKTKFDGYASEKWIIEADGGYYKIKNFASGKQICIRYDYLTEDEYFIQTSEKHASTSRLQIIPVDLSKTDPISGMYMLKNTYTNMYLTVQNESTATNAQLVTTNNPSTVASLWTVEKREGGAYILRNVKSNKCAALQYRSNLEGTNIVQVPSDNISGEHLWHLYKSEVPIPNIYFFNNIYSGRSMYIQNSSGTPGAYITQQSSNNLEDTRMRWQLIPVSRIETEDDNEATTRIATDIAEMDQHEMTNEIVIKKSNNYYTIQSRSKKIKSVSVLSINGATLKKETANSYTCEINLSDLNTAVYVINILLEDNSVESRKVLISK